jgi:Bacterial sugar transferase
MGSYVPGLNQIIDRARGFTSRSSVVPSQPQSALLFLAVRSQRWPSSTSQSPSFAGRRERRSKAHAFQLISETASTRSQPRIRTLPSHDVSEVRNDADVQAGLRRRAVNTARSTGYLERALAVLLLVLMLPVLALIAVAIVLESRGPVFERRRILGQRGEPIELAVFRTTRAGSSAGRDARPTRVGRLLRSTGLVQVPSLWNVVTGDLPLESAAPWRRDL